MNTFGAPIAVKAPPGEQVDFSLVLGGPLFQLFRRAQLTDDALLLVRRRVIVISLIAWLPLLVLALAEGHLLGGNVAVPFLRDVDVHIRFLAAMPLLIIAEIVVNQRMRPAASCFLERGIVPDESRQRFDAALAAAIRLRNSVLAEVLLIAFVYTFGILVVWRQYAVIDTATWYAAPGSGGNSLTLAGMWFGFVSLPFFQFLLCRWYFRLFIWARFLWQVSRIPLSLIPTHPDRVAGLGFLSNAVYAFAVLAAAHGAMLAGLLANRIFYTGARLPDFKVEVAVVVVFVIILALGPLLLFVPQLAQAKRAGLREYGGLAERYVREFDTKWLRGGAPAGEPLLGSADFQSLADMGNSFEVIRTMRVAPIGRQDILRIVAATLAPVAPLGLTMMPLEDLVRMLIGIIV